MQLCMCRERSCPTFTATSASFFLLIMLNGFLSIAARSSVVVQWRRHGGGANGATCPPPQPPIGHAVRSMQIREDFHVGKNRSRFPGFAPTFSMNRRYGGLLWSYDYAKEGVVKVVEGVTLVGPQ